MGGGTSEIAHAAKMLGRSFTVTSVFFDARSMTILTPSWTTAALTGHLEGCGKWSCGYCPPVLTPTCHKNGINGFVEKPKCNEVYLAMRRPMGTESKLWGINESMSAKIQPKQRNTSQHLHPYEEQCVAHAQWTLQVIGCCTHKNVGKWSPPKTRKLSIYICIYTGCDIHIYVIL